jgi:poly-gamma-glutamate synthesis protein (capsule biosynthesis protein)
MRTISHRRGITTTLAALDDAGLGHAGTARSVEEAVVRVFDVSGVAVAHLSYTTFANSPPPARPWMNVAGSAREVIEAVRAVRGAGAEIVILSLHIAKEMLSYPTTYDRAFVADVTAGARIDLVIAHRPHVVQPVEVVNGAVVYWSVGNLLKGTGLPGTGKYEDQRTLDGLSRTR